MSVPEPELPSAPVHVFVGPRGSIQSFKLVIVPSPLFFNIRALYFVEPLVLASSSKPRALLKASINSIVVEFVKACVVVLTTVIQALGLLPSDKVVGMPSGGLTAGPGEPPGAV